MKQYVEVIAKFDEIGRVIPLYVVFDKRNYRIDRVKNITLAASLKSGGQGVRYTCKIGGQERFLFLEENLWFIEASD